MPNGLISTPIPISMISSRAFSGITPDNVDIIIRRGPSFDLPGKPIGQTTWVDGLDEAELAFATDNGRIFLGADQTRGLAQSTRKRYPYRNVEVLGEQSTDAFSKMHGDRLRRQDNVDYHSTTLPQTPMSYVIVEESPFIIASQKLFSAFVNYAIYSNGDVFRQGRLEIEYGDSSLPPELTDTYDVARSRFLDLINIDYGVSVNLNTADFAFFVVVENGDTYLKYMSAIPGAVTLRFNISIPRSI